MDNAVYSWKVKGLTKVNPDIAVAEIKKLQSIHGAITPELLVREAESKSSPLHSIFEWDNEKAAHNHRLQQARTLLNNIQVTIVSNGEPKEISVFEVTTKSEGYKSIDTFTTDDIEFIRNSTIQQLNSLKKKLKFYKEFDKAIAHIDKAIDVMV